MKFYPFPSIRTIDDLMPAIEGRDEIKVLERDGFLAVDYLYNQPDTFPALPEVPGTAEWNVAVLRRECRGALFTNEGDLLSRRLHKFFNMGERDETSPENIDFSQPHHILNKEDGSMLSPYIDPQEMVRWKFEQGKSYTQRVFWGTMMGWTDVAQMAEEYIDTSNFDFDGFARFCLVGGWTPIFEWCSPKSRIVLPHDSPHMVLLSIRHNETGVYKTYEDMRDWADNFNIPYVRSFGRVDGDPSAFMDRVHGEKDIEGYVVQFANGHCVKIKTSWYLRFHKAKENLVFEKDVWNLILQGDVDDVMPVLMDHDKAKLEVFQEDFFAACKAASDNLLTQVEDMAMVSGADRGKYADLVKENKNLPGKMKGMAFRLFGGGEETAMDLILKMAGNSVSSASNIDAARQIINVEPW